MRIKIYTKYISKLKDELIKEYDRQGLRASGKYEDELQEILSRDNIKLLGAFHSYFMEFGRKPNSNPDDYKKLAPVIYKWIDNKDGLPSFFRENQKSMSFAIAHKIANEGIKVPNKYNKGQVISKVVEEFIENEIPKMLNEIELIEVERIESDFVNELSKKI